MMQRREFLVSAAALAASPYVPFTGRQDHRSRSIRLIPFVFRLHYLPVPDPNIDIHAVWMKPRAKGSPRPGYRRGRIATLVYRLPGQNWQIDHKIKARHTLQTMQLHDNSLIISRNYWLDLGHILPGYELICHLARD
jgi:hypothetical protein